MIINKEEYIEFVERIFYVSPSEDRYLKAFNYIKTRYKPYKNIEVVYINYFF